MLGLLLLVLLVVLWLWWWPEHKSEEKATPTTKTSPPVVLAAAEPTEEATIPGNAVEPPQVESPSPDDLKRIEGIGPKISSILQAAGITTFAQLAESDVNHLEQILEEANIRLADPSTWSEQARLAAGGDWNALEALQGELTGGRRV
jgi:predicted flap endonuclease-1-like 5' DNA nuclease